MTLEFSHRTEQILIVTAAEADGFNTNIFRLDAVTRRSTTGESNEPWRRLDLPRPSKKLAQHDAFELAVTELYREATENEADTSDSGPPSVTAEQIIERAHAAGLRVIGDSLRQHLGDVPLPYALGFERAIDGLPPPKEVTLALYLAGYEDGQTAYPILFNVGAVTEVYRNPRRWRDPSNMPRNEGIVLSDSDQFADYTIELMALDIQPVFEPGYPPAEGEIRELRVKHYLQATATLYERPLPKDWHHRIPPDDRDFMRRLTLPSRWPEERRRRVEHGMGDTTIEDGILKITASFGRTGDDESSEDVDPMQVLVEMKRIVGSTIAMLEERRREDPDSFVRDPVTNTLQQQAAELRWRREQGPTQIPEISDEREAELQAQGQSAQASVRAWNEDSRRGFERSMARLAELEQRLRERSADPYGSGGWRPRHERGDRHWSHDGEPYSGWEPYSAPGISDEQLLYEIAQTVERVRPREFNVRLGERSLIEIRPREPEVVVVEQRTSDVYEPIPQRYQELMRALRIAAVRWRGTPWDIPNIDNPSMPGRWIGNTWGRWHVSIQHTILDAEVTPPSRTKLREEHVYLEVLLAPPGSRAPVEWEC